MNRIFLITDYQGRFGTKYTAVPYRSGMDKDILKKEFLAFKIEPVFLPASEVHCLDESVKDKIFLYSSSEDRGGYYKSFIEDVVLALECKGAIVVPGFKFLRAHNNKLLIELLRTEWGTATGDSIRSYCFGSMEEFGNFRRSFDFPVVIKKSEGYKSRGVYLARSERELKKIIRHLTSTFNGFDNLKDLLRMYIHKGFKGESQHRKKVLLQSYVSGLRNDWKVLIYGNKYYPLLRETRVNDFRASGSGLLSFPRELPEGLLDFTEGIVKYFNVPQLSADIGYDGTRYYVFELQFVYFGTYTIEHSRFYFTRENGEWKLTEGVSELETNYVESMVAFLSKESLL
jgi:hypothetical protein